MLALKMLHSIFAILAYLLVSDLCHSTYEKYFYLVFINK